jgi:hypothetical protein
MRTTLDLDDDVLITAKDLARRQKRTAGEVISELARIGLRHSTGRSTQNDNACTAFLGFEPIPPGGAIATNEEVNRLREEVGD